MDYTCNETMRKFIDRIGITGDNLPSHGFPKSPSTWLNLEFFAENALKGMAIPPQAASDLAKLAAANAANDCDLFDMRGDMVANVLARLRTWVDYIQTSISSGKDIMKLRDYMASRITDANSLNQQEDSKQ